MCHEKIDTVRVREREREKKATFCPNRKVFFDEETRKTAIFVANDG